MKRFENMKIAKKMIVGFMVIALVAVLVAAIGIVNILSISGQATLLYEKDALGLQYTGELGLDFQQLRYYLVKTLALTDQQDLKENAESIQELLKATNDSFERFRTEITLSGDNGAMESRVNDFESSMHIFESYLEMHTGFLENGSKAKADNFILTTMAPLGDQMRDDLIALMAHVAEHAEQEAEKNAQNAVFAVMVTVGVLVVGIVIAVVLASRIAKIISKPVVKMAELGKLLATGDLNIDKVLTENDSSLKLRRDEVGELAAAFDELLETSKLQVGAIQKLATGDLRADVKLRSEDDALGKALTDLNENLNELLASIVISADQVTSGATLVSGSSMALSQGATEQASSIQELTASLDEIANKTTLNAKNAEQANEFVVQIKASAEDGNGQMKDMLQAMEDINESSGSINKIIKVIDDIAFQTNILALNAAVEAARAGVHGKGFAVVAEEVRTLAAKSAGAARETTELIENSIRKVDTGSRIAVSTAKALEKIMEQVDKAAALVDSISDASDEQAASVSQINQGISQVSQVVQMNAATAEEGAAASQELSAQSAHLMQTIGVFRTKKFIKTVNSFGSSKPVSKAIPLEATKALAPQGFGKY
jgi:methyl-accepting chemotaxis protein